MAEGWTIENTSELLAFMAQYPEEVDKWNSVFALGEASRWVRKPDSHYVGVPFALVHGARRGLGVGLFYLYQFHSSFGVLVSRK